MNKFTKYGLLAVILTCTLSLAEIWYKNFLLGRYWEYSSFTSTAVVGFIIPMFVLWFMFLTAKSIIKS